MKRLRVAELWNSFSQEVLSANCSNIQRSEMRRAFHAGAAGLLSILVLESSAGDEVTAEDAALYDDVSDELRAFAKDVAEGRA